MKSTVTFLILVLFSSNAISETIQTRLHSIINGKNAESDLVRFENGRVAFLEKTKRPLREELEKKNFIEVVMDKRYEIISIKNLKMQFDEPPYFDREATIEERPPYTPTILKDLNEATSMFKRLNANYQRVSLCFNRAHVWSYEEFNKNNISSMKTFIFFTASYINKNRFNWWFHVAPMVYVQAEDRIEERVLDYRYSHGPLLIKEWSDLFVFNKRPCKFTTKFSEYDVNPQTEECYLINTTMYYWQPNDIHNEELQSRYMNNFSKGAVRTSYSEAF